MIILYSHQKRVQVQIKLSKKKFYNKFHRINALYHNHYAIKSPDGISNVYNGMNKPMYFYHISCKRFFKERPSSLLDVTKRDGKQKKYLCRLCNMDYEQHKSYIHKSNVSETSVATALKIKIQHLHVAKLHFIKQFNKSDYASDYVILLKPNHLYCKYLGQRHYIWVYHKSCHHFFKVKPPALLRKRVNPLCPFCKKSLFKYEKLIIFRMHHSYTYGNDTIDINSVKNRTIAKYISVFLTNGSSCIRYTKGNSGGCRTNTEFLKEVYAQADNRDHTYTPIDSYRGNMNPLRWLYWSRHRSYLFLLTPNEFLNQGIRYSSKRKYYYKGERACKKYLDYYGLKENVDYFHSYIFHTNKNKSHCLHADFY